MAVVKLSPMEVANEFIRQYYVILNHRPESLHRFYKESSVMGWPELDDDMATTLNGIHDKIMASEYKGCKVEVKTMDAQATLDDAVIVAVTGWVIVRDDVKKYFSQTFILAKQEIGFFVLNDILRVLDIPLSVTTADENNGAKNDQLVLPSKVKDVTPSVAEATVPTSIISPMSPLPSDVKACSVVALAPAPKITYASMVAKKALASAPNITVVKSNACNRTKPSTPCATGAAKVSSPSNAASKDITASPTKVAPKSPSAGSTSAHYSANEEAGKGIYIGRLPYEITKQGIIDVVKQFGPVKKDSDSVQIRRHEDGFCCGFVEFESVESAHRAVEAHYITFGKDESSYISYKRSNHGNDGGRHSPISRKGRFQNATRGSRQSSPAWQEVTRHEN